MSIIVMPQLGQAMESGVVLEWMAADGAAVVIGQLIAQVESDKAVYEIEAHHEGILRHAVMAGDQVAVGEAIARVESGQADTIAVPSLQSAASESIATPVSVQPRAAEPNRALASPKARVLAQQTGLDLAGVPSRRADGLIVAADVDMAAAQSVGAAASLLPTAIPMTRLRRTAAERLTRSWQQAPHFVQMIEVDASRLSRALELIRERRVTYTFNDLLIKLAADTLAQFPDINARYANGTLVPQNSVDVGLAVATPEGLTVPVIRRVHTRSLADIAENSAALVGAARAGRLTTKDLGQASLTVSNLGRYGVAFGTPVLNLDEPILIFVGAIQQRPVGVNGQIKLLPMTTLSICFDHRVVDGLRAAEFSQAIKQAFEALAGVLPDEDHAEPKLGERELAAFSGEALAVSLQSHRHRWVVDEPPELGGADSGPDPVTLALSGLLSCMIVAFKLTARRRKVVLTKVEGRLTATPSGKVKEITIALDVWSDADPAIVQKLLAPSKATCLVHDLLRPDLSLALELQVHSV
jgi:pyruvate/2-oxoglutarate dehydrogenase complex dihydrolipoamide acyltransferase (E2) component/uncharacterized OsmC-like protein